MYDLNRLTVIWPCSPKTQGHSEVIENSYARSFPARSNQKCRDTGEAKFPTYAGESKLPY